MNCSLDGWHMEGRPHTRDDASRKVEAGGDALGNCVAFLSAFAERRAKRVVRLEHGSALFDDELPRAWDLNVLWLTSTAAASAEELAAEAERLQAGRNLAHRKVIVPGPEGEQLAAAFGSLGWQSKSRVVMRQTHEGRPVDIARVREVSAYEMETFWVEGMRQAPWANDEVVRQLVAAQLRRQRAADVRYFAVLVDGLVASACELFCHEGIAQVESVLTVERHRGKGFASAVVSRASTEARAAGNELVFLLADAIDRPQRLYRELGFEPVGSIWEFTRLPT
jgi:GNAT superfamily N-acetyltransferase